MLHRAHRQLAVARLRDRKTDRNLLLLRTEMAANHEYARMLDHIAETFENLPETWTSGAAARRKDGSSTTALDADAVCWCQSGARELYGVWPETLSAIEQAAAEMGAPNPNASESFHRGIYVNDWQGREGTIAMLRRAAETPTNMVLEVTG